MTGKMKTTHHWWADYRTGVSGVDQPDQGAPSFVRGNTGWVRLRAFVEKPLDTLRREPPRQQFLPVPGVTPRCRPRCGRGGGEGLCAVFAL